MNCKFRIPNDSSKVLWEITNQCNYTCKYCIFSSNSKKDLRELSTDECIKVIDELYDKNFKYIKVTGGEPFLRKDIINILTYMCQKGMHVDISTNGSSLTENIINKLNEIKLDMLHLSLDGKNSFSHEIVRGENTYLKTIRALKQLSKLNLYKRVGTVIHKYNESELEEIINLCINYKVNEIIFSIMEPVGRMKGDNSFYKTRKLEDLTNELEQLSNKYDQIIINYNWKKQSNLEKTCPALSRFIYINNLGNVSPCSWISSKYTSALSLRNNSLDEIFESNEIKKFKEIYGGCAYELCSKE